MTLTLTSSLLLDAYAQGLFPMADTVDSPSLHWVCPEDRGQLSIVDLHIPRSLAKDIRRQKIGGTPYEIRVNTAFDAVIEACAAATDDRPESWINGQISAAFKQLHADGFAHSVECWVDDALVGGLYGVALGGTFCGESMFSRHTNASKVCLIHLCARLWLAGYSVLDTQFTNEHLEQFGVYEVSHDTYLKTLHTHMGDDVDFACTGKNEDEVIGRYMEMRAAQ